MSINSFNLTEPQKAILSTEQFFPNTSINDISGRVLINSKIDVKLLEKAINIRYQFSQDNDSITQYEKEYKFFPVDYIYLTPENKEEVFNSISRRVFSLFKSPLYYFAIYETNNHTGGFFVCVHHLICDAWSMSILVNSIISIYSGLLKNENIDFSYDYDYLEFVKQEEKYA